MIKDQTLTFEVLGMRQNVLTMVDRQTGTVWQHLDGTAIQGPLSEIRMSMIPLLLSTWLEWRRLHPGTLVLSQDTQFKSYYKDVETGRFDFREATFGDKRLRSNTLVIGVEVSGQFKGYPIDEIKASGGVVNDNLSGVELVIFYDPKAGTGIAYSRRLGNRILSFINRSAVEFHVMDLETHSSWNIDGTAISGGLKGESLRFVPSFVSEWYGWSGYHPETELYSRSD